MSANPELFTAIEKNDLAKVKAILSFHPKETYKDAHGNTALHLAIIKGHIYSLIDYIISEFPHYINIQNDMGETPLMLICVHGYYSDCLAFLKNPKLTFNLRLQDRRGYTLLHYACNVNHLELVKLLIETPHFNVDVNQCDNDGYTALMLAASRGYTEIIQYLLDSPQVNIKYTNRSGDNAFNVAGLIHNPKFMKMLEEKLETAKGVNKELFTAIKDNEIAKVKTILSVHPKEPYKDLNGDTILHHAAAYGHKELVDYIISEFPHYINIQNCWGKTPLMLACTCKHKAIYHSILTNPTLRIDTRLKDRRDGYTLLHYASVADNLDFAKELLEKPHLNVDVNQYDHQQYTVLMAATLREQTEMIQYLLDVPGINIGHRTWWDDSALNLAYRTDKLNVIKPFRNKFNSKPFDLKTTSDDAQCLIGIAMSGQRNDIDLDKLLAQLGPQINTAFFVLKTTALHCAIQRKDFPLAFRLLMAGANASLKNCFGQTPLDMAEDDKEAYLFIQQLHQVKLATKAAIEEITRPLQPIETKQLTEKKEIAEENQHHLYIEMDKKLNILIQYFNTLSEINQQRTAFLLGSFLAFPHALVYHPEKAYEILSLVPASDLDYAQAQAIKKELLVDLNNDLGSETRSKVTLQHEVEALKKEAEAQKHENELLKQRLATTATKALEVATETQKLSNELLTQRLNSATQALEVANEAQKYLLRELEFSNKELETSQHAGLLLQAKASQSSSPSQNDVTLKLKLDLS